MIHGHTDGVCSRACIHSRLSVTSLLAYFLPQERNWAAGNTCLYYRRLLIRCLRWGFASSIYLHRRLYLYCIQHVASTWFWIKSFFFGNVNDAIVSIPCCWRPIMYIPKGVVYIEGRYHRKYKDKMGYRNPEHNPRSVYTAM